MQYKLSSTLTGKIKNKKVNETVFRIVTVSFGTIVVCASMFNVIKSKKYEEKIRDEVSSISTDSNINYTDEISRMLGVSFDDNYIQDIDYLCSYLKLAEEYKKTDKPIEKYTIKNKLLDNYKKIDETSLLLLKKKIADNSNVDDVEIYVGRDGNYATVGKEDIRLTGENLDFALALAHFQGYNVESLRKNSESFDKYVDALENVVFKSFSLIEEKDKNINVK